MRALEFHARMYEPGSPHPRLVRVSLERGSLVVKYDEGDEVLMPIEELELKPGPLSEERVVLASQTTRQSIVADDRRLLDVISREGAPPHLQKQISKSHFDRRVGLVKKSLGNIGLLILPAMFLGVLFIAFLIGFLGDDSRDSRSPTEESQEASPPAPVVPPGAPGAPETYRQDKHPDADAYLQKVQGKIRGNWHPPKSLKSKRVSVIFTVERNGDLGEIKIDKSSGLKAADLEAINTVKRSAPFPPIPKSLPDSVDVQFTFDYRVFAHH